MCGIKEKFAAALEFFIRQKKTAKITQKSLADQVGVSPTTLSDLKKGRRESDEEKRRKIAEALDFPYEHFLAFGEFLLAGVPGEEALEKVRSAIAAGSVVRPIPPRAGVHSVADLQPVASAVAATPEIVHPVEGGALDGGSVAVRRAKVAASDIQMVQPMERMLDGLSTYKEQEEARPSKRSSVLRQVVMWMDSEFAQENLARELKFMEAMKDKFPSFKSFSETREGK